MARTLSDEIQQTKAFSSSEEAALLSVLRTADKLSYAMSHVFKAEGLSSSGYNVLRILRGSGATGLPAGEIGRRLVTSVPDVTRLLDRLESAGLVRRSRSRSDRRKVSVVATEDGLRLLARLDEPVEKAHRRLLGHLSRKKLEKLCRLLDEARNPDE